MALSIRPTGAVLGAVVEGLDLASAIDDETFGFLRDALFRHQALVIRGSRFDQADQVRFTQRFGPLRPSNMRDYVLQDHPEVFIVSNIKEGERHIGVFDAGLFWHSDGSFMEQPHGVLALHAIEVPHDAAGQPLGDTVIASTTAAYEALSPAMKERLEGLRAVNTMLLRYEKTLDTGRRDTPVLTAAAPQDREWTHPVVRVHPITGAKHLYVNEGYTARIEGLPDDESRALVAELTAHCTRPEFQYRHRWQPDDLLLWDNQATQHKATFDYALPQRRLMHRTAALF